MVIWIKKSEVELVIRNADSLRLRFTPRQSRFLQSFLDSSAPTLQAFGQGDFKRRAYEDLIKRLQAAFVRLNQTK